MPLRKKIRTGYILTSVLLMTSYLFIFQSTWKLQREYNSVVKSYSAENKIAELKNFIIEAETSVRGFYITKDESYLKILHDNRARVPVIYNELKLIEEKNPNQLAKLDSIKQLIDSRLTLMKKNIDAFQLAGQQSTPEIEANHRTDQILLDSIRFNTQQFISAEEKLMNERKNKLTSSFTSTQIITFISLLTSILAIFYSLLIYNKESSARDESTRKNIQYQRELEANIEDQKRMDAEVRELKNMEKFMATGRVARTIAHEIRNPLTNISLATEQLQDTAVQNNESSMLLDMISRNAVRINQLISDLLNATKVIELNILTVSINKILDDALEMAADRIDLGQVKVEKKYASDVCDVAVDEDKIRIVFLNIIVNAIEAMEKNKGILFLRTHKAEDNCIIEIEDNGVGMDEDTLQNLFEPYFTTKSKRNGLGLTNCQSIIMSHRGKIAVKSTPGTGTVFIITIKLAVQKV